MLLTRLVRDGARTGGPGSSLLSDLVLGVLLAGFVALLVVSMPPIGSAVLALILLGVAVVTAQRDAEVWGRYLLVATAVTQPWNGRYWIPVPINDALLILTFGTYLLVRLRGRTSAAEVPQRTVLLGLAILGFGGLIGAIFEAPGALWYRGTAFPLTDVTGWSWNTDAMAAFTIGTVLPVALWALVRPTRALVRRVMEAFVAGCAVSVLFGLAVPGARAGGRLSGLAMHALQQGGISLVGVAVATALVLGRRRSSPWVYGCLFLLVLGVVLSGSRSALGGLFVFGLVIGPFTRRRGVFGVVLLGAALAVILFLSGAVKAEGSNAIGRTFGDDAGAVNSSDQRADLAERVLDRWRLRPFTGNGFNHMRPAHNVYLGVLASAGVLGIIGFATVVSGVLRRAWRARADLMAMSLTAGFVGYLASAYFDYLLWWRWLWFYIGMTMALLALPPRSRAADPEDVQPIPDDEVPRSGRLPAPAELGSR